MVRPIRKRSPRIERCTGIAFHCACSDEFDYGHAGDRARSLAAGLDHHLVEPLDAEALIELVAQRAAAY
ncbi:MAG: hypothetical protein H7244_05075 [Herminiimonas sp.]|nr:hypothetical protein [Herminiimonas sp.]